MAKRPKKPKAPPEAKPAEAASTGSDTSTAHNDRPLNSAESALRLADLLKRLEAHPQFATLAGKRLGEYWEKDWMRAPFEEELTLQQILKLPPRALLEKRSVSPKKLSNIMDALERALSQSAPNNPARPVTRPTTVPISSAKDHAVSNLSASIPTDDYVSLITRLVERYKNATSLASDPLSAALAAQSVEPEPEELKAIVLASDEELSLVADTTESQLQAVKGFRELARKKLRGA